MFAADTFKMGNFGLRIGAAIDTPKMQKFSLKTFSFSLVADNAQFQSEVYSLHLPNKRSTTSVSCFSLCMSASVSLSLSLSLSVSVCLSVSVSVSVSLSLSQICLHGVCKPTKLESCAQYTCLRK